MKLLFVILPEKGHIHPMLGPARCLKERGCEVAFYASHDVSATLRCAGFDRFVGGDDGLLSPPDGNRGARFAELVRDRARLRGWIRDLLLDGVPREVERLKNVVQRERPDALVIDPMAWAGAIVAHQNGLPWVGLSSSLNPVVPDAFDSELIATAREMAPARDALLSRYGMEARFRVVDILSPRLTVVFSTPALVGAPPPGVELVGPSRFAGPRGDETALPAALHPGPTPLLYMSLGSQIHHQPAMFRAVFEAVRGRPVRLLAAVGELLGDALLGDLPENVIATRYAPQRDLLESARVMITHGGANSVMEALDAGVPLLVSPICNDAFHNARFVAEAGAGVSLDLATAEPARVWSALSSLLDEGPLREGAARIGRSYRAHDGAARAADLILERCR